MWSRLFLTVEESSKRCIREAPELHSRSVELGWLCDNSWRWLGYLCILRAPDPVRWQHSLAPVQVGSAVLGDALGGPASASEPGVTSVYLQVRFWVPRESTLDCFPEHLLSGLRPTSCRLLQPMSSSPRVPQLQKLSAWPSLGPREEQSQFSRPGSVPGPLGCDLASLS